MIFNTHHPHLLWTVHLPLIILWQVIDIVTTRYFTRYGGAEGNPLMFGAAHSLPRMIVVKVLITGILAWGIADRLGSKLSQG